MAITVDSSQWTGERSDAQASGPVVWGEYADEAARQAALARLRAEGARNPGEAAPAANAGQVEPPDEHPEQAERRNLRQNAVGIAMASSAMAAAGLVIATGGAALPAVAAAAAAGVASGAVGEAVATAAVPSDVEPTAPPDMQGPVIGLRAPDAAAQTQAERLLRETGARRIVVQDA